MPSARFYESPPWRFIVTDLDSVTLTFLDKLAENRTVTPTLNQPAVVSGQVPSDNPQINIEHTDGEPVLNEGDRLLYCFRREADGTATPWVCRASGIILNVRDNGNPTVPETEFRAYDPWQYLYRRPVVDLDGLLPCEAVDSQGDAVDPDCQGFTYLATRGSDIALELLVNTTLNHGETHIDYGSVFWQGTIEDTDVIAEILFQQGSSVGEAFDALVETGTLDIILTPVYDPDNRPGITHELSIYSRAGSPQYEAVFAWDKPSRSVVELTANFDGNERANNVQYYAGQGGPPVPLQVDGAAVTAFGEYWTQQFFPGQTKAAAVEKMALAQLLLRARGLTTYTMSPAPERSPIPFVDYNLGDTIPVYASDRMRRPVAEMLRVTSIPLVIADDQMEAGQAILLTPDEAAGT
jgi:hypothetical protein